MAIFRYPLKQETMNTFAQDVEKGLSHSLKRLSSKYFYDDTGSRIFREIMNMPSYYLTNCEDEILRQQAGSIYQSLGFDKKFNIIELGAGDGAKTRHFLQHLSQNEIDFIYVPVDISSRAMELLESNIREEIPGIKISPIVGDYHQVMKKDIANNIDPNLLLFLGSNIGNYSQEKAVELLELFQVNMKAGDKLLIGIDLKKNPLVIHEAYFDQDGITKSFNLNLLERINRELGGTFILKDWDFYCHYNPVNGEVRSYLVSLEEQTVYIEELDKHYHFEKHELIWTELSRKYSLGDIEELAQDSGFSPVRHFMDKQHYFTDSLWKKT